jgi:hypothetical protein
MTYCALQSHKTTRKTQKVQFFFKELKLHKSSVLHITQCMYLEQRIGHDSWHHLCALWQVYNVHITLSLASWQVIELQVTTISYKFTPYKKVVHIFERVCCNFINLLMHIEFHWWQSNLISSNKFQGPISELQVPIRITNLIHPKIMI